MRKILSIITILFVLTGCSGEKYQVVEEHRNDSKKYTEYTEITYDEYSEKVKNNDSFIMLVYQTGCSHCESFEPKLNDIVKQYNLEVFALNLSNLTDKEYAILKNKTFISGTPSTVYIEDGKYEDKLEGNKDKEKILEFLVDINYLEEK